jgi:CRP-like cAMP-binding protein
MTDYNENSQIELLQRMPVFGGIRADTLQVLLQRTNHVEVMAGEFYYHEGDPANSLFVLLSGKVLLLKNWRANNYVLKKLKRSNCFGEVALLDLMPRNTSAYAAVDSSAIEISNADLHYLYGWDRDQFTLIHMNMAREVCRRLREADERLFAADMKARKITGTAARLTNVS